MVLKYFVVLDIRFYPVLFSRIWSFLEKNRVSLVSRIWSFLEKNRVDLISRIWSFLEKSRVDLVDKTARGH